MIEPRVHLLLSGNRRRYSPGEELSLEYRLNGVPADAVDAVELSVLWHTEGKGDEDLVVHFFERRTVDAAASQGDMLAQRMATILPSSPLSYAGVIVKLRWCVRARAFLHGGKQLFDEQTFQLGDVSPARAVVT